MWGHANAGPYQAESAAVSAALERAVGKCGTQRPAGCGAGIGAIHRALLVGTRSVDPINAHLRDELLDRQLFCTLRETQIVIGS